MLEAPGGIRRTENAAMVGTRGAAAAASSDRDAGGTSRAAPSSSAAAATGGNEETGGSPNNTEVSHDDVVSNVTNCRNKIAGNKALFGATSIWCLFRRTTLATWRADVALGRLIFIQP